MAASLAVLAVAGPADALSCARFGDDQMDDFLGAEIVVIGTASGLKNNPDQYYMLMDLEGTFHISETLKGDISGDIGISQYSCSGSALQEDGEYVVFASRDKNRDGYSAHQVFPVTGTCYNDPQEGSKSCQGKLVELWAIAQFYKEVILSGQSGKFETRFDNGRVKTERNYNRGKLHGVYRTFYSNGQLRYTVEYVGGKRAGVIRHYYDDGAPYVVFSYKNGYRHGDYKFYDQKTGRIVSEHQYDMGQEITDSDSARPRKYEINQ